MNIFVKILNKLKGNLLKKFVLQDASQILLFESLRITKRLIFLIVVYKDLFCSGQNSTNYLWISHEQKLSETKQQWRFLNLKESTCFMHIFIFFPKRVKEIFQYIFTKNNFERNIFQSNCCQIVNNKEKIFNA